MKIDVESRIAAWKAAIQRDSHLPDESVQELEDHLRDEMETLKEAGLNEEEALIIGLRRMGDTFEVAREIARVDSDTLWKNLLGDGPTETRIPPREIAWVVGAALLAALLGKIPRLFGVPFEEAGFPVYARNLPLFAAPVLFAAYLIKNRPSVRIGWWLLALAAASVLAANLYPFPAESHTSTLFAIHLPLLLWLGVGLAYCGDEWRTVRSPVDFIRFTGEFFLYSVLILCGGFVLVQLVIVFFEAIDIPAAAFAIEWIGFSGLLATPVVAAYLVEKKRSLIENLAPVLAKLFIPLFVLMMTGYIVAVAIQRQSIVENRNMLITLDLLLVLVLGMVLYDLSARREREGFSLSQGLNIALIAAAIVIDLIALYGIAVRLSDYGFSPNRTAALGENILLLVNLAGLGATYARFARGKSDLAEIWRWQVRYLPAYAVWFAFVVFAFPPLFGYL